MSKWTEKARKVLEKDILELKGEKREKAKKAYRRLLSSSTDEPVYYKRSE